MTVQREVTENVAWSIANKFLLADTSGRDLPLLQMEIRAAIQSALDHEREACAKIAESDSMVSVDWQCGSRIAAAIRKRTQQ